MTDQSPLASFVSHHLRHDDADPLWPDRDRVVACGDAATIPGPAGLAFGAALGMAMAERLLAARFGRSLVDHRTWLLADPAELAAGTAHEAAAIAGALQLGRLIVLAAVPPAEARSLASISALGWNVRKLDALDRKTVDGAISAALRSQKPTLIACIGAACATPRTDPPGSPHGAGARRAWLKRLRRHAQSEQFHNAIAGRLVVPWPHPQGAATNPVDAVSAAIARLAPSLPELFLLPPEPGATLHSEPANLKNIPWSGRTQAAAAALLGIAHHGGLVPFGRFSLPDAEAARPAVRAAATLNLRGIHLLTETGPACPIGGLRAGWRSMRNVLVLRPADAAEAEECLALALRRTAGPSLLLLADHPAAALPESSSRACARGGYLVLDPPHRDATLVAAGPELHLALQIHAALAEQALQTAVVSLPCWTLFAAQDAAYRAAVLGTAPRIGLEAGTGAGWPQWLGPDELFLDTGGIDDPGALLPVLTRHLRRGPAIPESGETLLESDTTFD
jgi:transketolase